MSVALVFDKPSTRTRVSFETGVYELGGHPLVLREGELQLARGESPTMAASGLGIPAQCDVDEAEVLEGVSDAVERVQPLQSSKRGLLQRHRFIQPAQ
jgi:hypothetical protein